MLPIVRTRCADSDLFDIWAGIAVDNPVAADRVLDAIERRWQQLRRYPRSGMARDDIGAGIRHLVVGQYLTLYRITGAGIEIVRVLHGRRDIGREAVVQATTDEFPDSGRHARSTGRSRTED